MKPLSKIIKQILADWHIELDFTDKDLAEFEKDLHQMSAYEKKMLNKAIKEYQGLKVKEAYGELLHLNFEIHLN